MCVIMILLIKLLIDEIMKMTILMKWYSNINIE